MKLVLHIVLFLVRFGWALAGLMAVLFIAFLLRQPITDTYRAAATAREQLPGVLQEIEELSVRRSVLQRELMEGEGSARQLGMQVFTAESVQIPQLQAAQAALAEARASAERQVQVATTAVQQTVGRNVGFGPPPAIDLANPDPSVIAVWVQRQVTTTQERCNISRLSLEYWRDPVGNFTFQWGCEELQSRLGDLQQWHDSVTNSLNTLRERRGDIERVTQQATTTAAELTQLSNTLTGQRTELEQANALQQEHQTELNSLMDALESAETRRARMESAAGGVAGWTAQLTQEWELWKGWLWQEWVVFWPRALALIAVVWLTPYVWRGVWYYVGAPVISRARPMQLIPGDSSGKVALHPSERTAALEVRPGGVLLARAAHVRQVETGLSRTRFFYDRRYPGVSFLTGLFMMTEIRIPADRATPSRLTLAATGPDSADSYTMRVDLRDHPGFVISPTHIVAVTDGLTMKSEWRWNWHSFIRGQFRYIMLAGTGSIWMEGYGDVHGQTLTGQETHQESTAYIAFDGRLQSRARRTETFWPYLLGNVPLFESGLKGHGSFVWQKSPLPTGSNAFTRTLGTFWSALGKFVGL